MSIVDQVGIILNNDNNNITSSQFYYNYQTLLSKYNLLIEKGVVEKRQSQLCSISDKLQLITFNCNYYKSKKR